MITTLILVDASIECINFVLKLFATLVFNLMWDSMLYFLLPFFNCIDYFVLTFNQGQWRLGGWLCWVGVLLSPCLTSMENRAFPGQFLFCDLPCKGLVHFVLSVVMCQYVFHLLGLF